MGTRPVVTHSPLNSAAYEQHHVHSVYEEIAHHFSSTRYKPWPIIASFLTSLAPGSVGLDVGCGNGKYLGVNPRVFVLASDRSTSLAAIAKERVGGGGGSPGDVFVADALCLPHPEALFDFAICIAVVHHLSTKERRVQAIAEVLGKVRAGSGECAGEGGRALFYVWALEQKGSRRGWDEGCEQDVMVPWVTKTPKEEGSEEKVFKRYYHLYRKGELEEDVLTAGGNIVSSGYEKDNWWVIASRPPT